MTAIVAACWLLVLSMVDAVLTLSAVARGATEINPAMAWLLSHGGMAFAVGKQAIVTAGVIGLAWAAGRDPKARGILWALVIVYAAVVGWSVAMLAVMR